jgi:hypothetical protein
VQAVHQFMLFAVVELESDFGIHFLNPATSFGIYSGATDSKQPTEIVPDTSSLSAREFCSNS